MQRKIIHVDMDCFYAAIEMRDNPAYRDIPLAVGGAPDRRGVISTCNYIAREFGVHSAMATAYAIRLCPNLTVVPGRMQYYKDISAQIRNIFRRYTEIIEPLSLDEAYLDVTEADHCRRSATLMAKEIRTAIHEELGLTASAGIAPNKFIAKICSDLNKPDGQYVVAPEEVGEFVKDLPLKKIPGVGKVTQKRLEKLGLYTCADIRALGKSETIQLLGNLGNLLAKRAWGIDDRELTTTWVRKSVSVERTFPEDIHDSVSAIEALTKLFKQLSERLTAYPDRKIKNLQVKLKFSDFTQTTIERAGADLQLDKYVELLPRAWERGKGQGIRLLGLGVALQDAGYRTEDHQLTLF
ncbi:MAG TPA: DNA polymerase IV [Gammaproteobacteria bacterium]|nr:DNA polymerase IV [Gammaproteobacteria bacterium]|tara:strand:+ start:3483 stop:4541 length:1059 start_codon:yes stop_codon:yes gene_type:complete